MIAEIFVLLGIEHFKERRRGITVGICCNLINFIQNDNGIKDACVYDSLHHSRRRR